MHEQPADRNVKMEEIVRPDAEDVSKSVKEKRTAEGDEQNSGGKLAHAAQTLRPGHGDEEPEKAPGFEICKLRSENADNGPCALQIGTHCLEIKRQKFGRGRRMHCVKIEVPGAEQDNPRQQKEKLPAWFGCTQDQERSAESGHEP